MNDGGPAFPRPCSDAVGHSEMWNDSEKGMSLRDYFAGQALKGWLSNSETVQALEIVASRTSRTPAALSAQAVYGIADAMLAEREKKAS